MPADNALMSLTETAYWLRCGADVLRRRIARNRGECPPHVRVGKAIVFRAGDVRKWLEFQQLGAD